jgi:2-(1,2-epoxy-1,2-dihydrophenyl)acetyl-CoA isomerase
MSKEVLFEIKDGVGCITLNRPDVLNSFNRKMALMMQDALDECAENEEVRCVKITGAGRAFCAGQDLQEAISKEGPELQEIVKAHYNPIILKIRGIEKPVVSVVNGVAAGAGANIALACDFCIAGNSASFIQAFSKIGLIPDSGGTFTLPRLVGFQRATALMMLGDKVSAEEAQNMGMIYRAVDDSALQTEADSLCQKLALMPTKGLGLTKRALNLSMNNDLGQQLDVEESLQTKAGQTHDYNEGVNAFLQKRKPVFTGK